ncbi:hypothetical protein RHMOL_Rhmol09G0113700 [Rhododendron molle]|uniref:Uncharacterized protein n=1 Tax=Rhododendron molle TaxID=49168 RepID=A0ACC0MBY5_RHOML|nr:hypothetical protein RHMOL_Rhmol09G0113700 [Rhododendron molle]
MHIRLKSIKPVTQHHDIFHLLSFAHTSSITSRPICTKTENNSHDRSFLPPDHSPIVDGLISIFQNRPFSPHTLHSPETTDFGSKLTPTIVETVLKSLQNWKIAHLFFNWASQQPGYRHTCYTYNVMASILSRARRNDQLRGLALELVNSRCLMTPGALGFFVRCLGGVGLAEEANSLFDRVKKTGLCIPNSYSYNCLLEALAKSTASVCLVEVRLKEMQDLGWEPDKYTLTPLLQCYCNAGKFGKALEVFNSMYEKGWMDTHVVVILVVSFSKWGEVDKAFELVERMEDHGIRLNEKTISVLIHGFVRESRVDKALQVLYKMRKLGYLPDVSVYDVLMGGLCRNEDVEKALILCSEMKNLGVYPDVEMLTKLVSILPEGDMVKLLEDGQEELGSEAMILLYNSILNGLVNKGSVSEAYYLLRAMMGDECDCDVQMDKVFRTKKMVRPDTNSFDIVIKYLCKTDNLDMALGLYQDMDRMNCKPSCLLYNNLIGSLSNANRVDECHKLLGDMKESGVQPTHFTYNSIFGCLCRRTDIEGAIGMLKEMRENGHEPWIKHTTLLVKMLCKHGRVADASNFLSSMVQEGFLPDIIPYSAAIDGFVKIQEVDRALQIFRDIGARECCADVVAYNIIINGLSKAGRVLEAHGILNEMQEKGLIPSVVTYNTIIDGLCKNGDIDQARLCFSTMVRKEREPNVFTYTTMINGLCNEGTPNEALELWTEMRELGRAPNRITFMTLVHGLCKCARPDDALLYFREMEEKGMTPDTYVYVALIEALLSNSNPLLAFKILREMFHSGIFPDPNDKNPLWVRLREAICKLSKDARTQSDIMSLITEGSIPIISSLSDIVIEDGTEPIA